MKSIQPQVAVLPGNPRQQTMRLNCVEKLRQDTQRHYIIFYNINTDLLELCFSKEVCLTRTVQNMSKKPYMLIGVYT